MFVATSLISDVHGSRRERESFEDRRNDALDSNIRGVMQASDPPYLQKERCPRLTILFDSTGRNDTVPRPEASDA